jgi:hypothetical protein
VDQPLVTAEYPAGEVDDVTFFGSFRAHLLHDRGIIAPGDEADVLAVRLVGDQQPEVARQLANQRLGQVA